MPFEGGGTAFSPESAAGASEAGSNFFLQFFEERAQIVGGLRS